ncbi:nuclease [candidate division KSB1 bacterium]|nr:MAG: nuclease [candidate division KSB1 bacterium]
MFEETPNMPFAELPAALVEEVLECTSDVGHKILESFKEIDGLRANWRAELESSNLLCDESVLEYVPIPTACGIDGSYAVERMLATDLVAAAAVAVEGLTPPSEKRHWPDPHHQVVIEVEPHNPDTSTIVRALMIGMELSLAVDAPHEIVFLDGSLTTPIIYFNQALNKANEARHLKITNHLLGQIKNYLAYYQTVLASARSDRCWVAVPKYTTRREIGKKLGWPESHDDRGLLSSILSPGEFTQPHPLQPPNQPWHINLAPVSDGERSEAEKLKDDLVRLLGEIHIIYYRPFPWLPALRLEMNQSIVKTPARLASVIHAVKHQCGTAAMMEPYPLYMADRMVKNLSRAIPTFRQVTSQRIAEIYQGDIDSVFLSLHGYRSESGR